MNELITGHHNSDLKKRITELESELKYKDSLLVQLEKLTTIGQFIRDIIHELKNPLSTISSYSELAIYSTTVEEKEKFLEQIPKGVSKISKRLSQFRTMAITTDSEENHFDMNEILMQCLSTLDTLKPKGTNILPKLTENKTIFIGDPDLWQQVILIITKIFFNNMNSSNPDLKIEEKITKPSEFISSLNDQMIYAADKKSWLDYLEKNSDWISLRFENDKLDIEKIFFEMSFSENIDSSLKFDKNTLGLIVAKDIVKRHNGNIVVSAMQEKGLIVEVFAPVKSNCFG